MGWAADILIGDHYKSYKEQANSDMLPVIDAISAIDIKLHREYRKVYELVRDVRNLLKIELYEYAEFRNPYGYNGSGDLMRKAYSYYGSNLNKSQLQLLKAIIRYCKIVKARVDQVYKLDAVSKRKAISQKTYTGMVKRYYIEMQVEVLKGNAYKFNSNLGILLINYVKTSTFAVRKRMVDFVATKIAKGELIANNKTPFDKRTYEAYEAAGVADQYVGIRYTVFKTMDDYFQVAWSRCGVKNFRNYKFKKTMPNSKTYADNPVLPTMTTDEVMHLPIMLTTKLIALVKRNPAYKNIFIRNKECHVFNYRKSNREDSK